MAIDQGLAQRIHDYFSARQDVETKAMFGGLCFMVRNHMCVGIVGDKLMARVGPNNYEDSLMEPNVTVMDFTGKPMRGMVYVLPEGLQEEQHLLYWLIKCEAFVESLPDKA